eukprot:COSAG05_NODE_5645_length_1123_cov_1.098633_1_plen_104_part_10
MRCGGFDHEYYTFWKEFDKERKARGTLGTDTLLRNDTPTNEASQEMPSPPKNPYSNLISDVSSIRDSLNLSGGIDEVLHYSNPSRPIPEVNGFAARAKTNPPPP